MIRKHTAIAMAMGLSVLGASSCALAGDFAFTPRAEVGMTSYSYEKSRIHSIGTDKVRDFSDTMFTGTIGATVSMNGFYLDGYWQRTAEGSDDYSSSSTVSDYRWETASDFDRQEYAATLGYSFNNGIKLFTGYQVSEVQFDENQDVYYQSTGAKSSSSYIYDYNLEGKGPFIGVGYGMSVGPGVLSGALSYIWLDADYDEKADDYWNGVYDGSPFQTSSNDGSGFKVGLAWNAPITGQLSYGVTVNGQWNSYDAALPNGDLNYAVGNDPQEHDETIVTAMASISYSFATK
jgi:hypothetical protein